MDNAPSLSRTPLYLYAGFILLLVATLLAPSGCKQSGHTSDSRLRQIDEMLDSQLPAGTPKSRVILYLNSQGFPIDNGTDPTAITATIHHIDTESLKPVTASATFHFDREDKLTTYELTAQ
ncbi:MAG TPA: hypothetical protein VMH48_07455 [Methylomirabilota bacterium]|nr:hypothetical protein [Methylomirabilota bacterium]